MPTPAPPAPKPHRTDRLFLWLFGGALLLLLLYRFWPEPPQTAPEPDPGPVVVEEVAPPSPEQWEASTPPSTEQQWEQPASADAQPGQAPDLQGLEEPSAVTATTPEPDDKVYTYVEQMPQPPGGIENLLQTLNRSIKYPAEARRNQVEGKVFVNFVVRTDGRITDAQISKGIGAGCDEEALRVVRQMPRWQPGKQNGRAVSVSYTVPVTFIIQ